MAFWRNSFLSFDNVICFQFLCVLHSVIRSGRCFYIAKQGFLQGKIGSFENQQPHIGVFNHCRTLYVTTPYDGYLSVCLCISAGMLKVDGSQFIASSCPCCGQLAAMKRYNIDIRHAIKQTQRCFATHCRDMTTLYEYVQVL